MKRLALLSLIAFSTAGGDEAPRFDGLWIHHDTWQMAPPEINEDGDIHKWANAAIINICPNGAFRLATGVMYQSTKSPSVQIGASDGLAIYRGSWSRTDRGVTVEYQLVDAEFMDLLDDPVASAKRAAELKLNRARIDFPFTNMFGKVYPLEFVPAASYEKKVIDEWVQCEPRKSPPPPPKRPRTGGDRGDGAS